MSFTKKILLMLLVAASLLSATSCSSDGDEPQDVPTEQTVIMFFPWSNTLYGDFQRSVRNFSNAVARRGLRGERVVVCMATDPTSAVLYELKCSGGKCWNDTLRRFSDRTFTSRSSMASLFGDIKAIAPAPRYGMVVGSHGLGWIPVSSQQRAARVRMHYDTAVLRTRYIGGTTPATQIEIGNFAGAMADASLHTEYILFDNCYMSSVEALYQLRHVTDRVVACPTEVLAYGFPYANCAPFLLGTPDLKAVADAFISYYTATDTPYATVAVIDCSQLDNLATLVREANLASTTDDATIRSDIQVMDGYSPTIFFDLGHYLSLKCSDATLRQVIEAQLALTVPVQGHTPRFYSALKGGSTAISHYSGLTTSEPSANRLAATVDETDWYKATH